MKKLLIYLTTLMMLVTSIAFNRPNVVKADETTLANAKEAFNAFKEEYDVDTGVIDWETLIKAARTYNLALEAEDNVDDLKSYYESITILDLSDQPIANQTYYDGTDIGSLAIFKGLKTLDLSNTNITKLGALASLTNLEILNLSGNKGLDEKGAIATLSNLKILSLEDTGFTNNDFGPIVALNNLVALNLMGNKDLTNIGPLAQCPNLKGLVVSDTGLTQLQEVATFPNILEYLGAKNLQLTSNQAISGLVEMTNRSGFDPSTSSLAELDPNLKTYYWDLDGSVMPSDPDNHVTMIKNKFTGGNFIPPKIGNKLDSPTDLFWKIDAIDKASACWTPIENITTEPDDRLVDNYLIYVEYGESKDDLNVKSEEYRIYDRTQKFQDFIDTYKEGYYRFTVQALAKEGNGYVDSDPVSSEIVKFNKFSYGYKTVDEKGDPIEGEVDSGFVALYDEDEGGSVRLEYIPDNVLLSLTSFPEAGYEYVGYTFTPELEDVEIDGMNAYFYLDKSSEAIVTFKRNNEPVKINIDFGEKHKELASKVLADINADNKHTATLSGSVLTIDWLINDTMNKVLDEYVLEFADLYLDEYGKDNNEYLSATPYGSKKINEYKDRTEMNDDWADVGRSFTADGMKVYLNWEVLATSGSFTLESPKCGTEVETAPIYNSEDPIEQTNPPVVKGNDDSHFVVSTIIVENESGEFEDVVAGYWYTSMPNNLYDYEKLLDGPIVEGQDYVAAFYVEPKPGYTYYYYAGNPSFTVNGKEPDKVSDYNELLFVTITAEHDWQFVDFTWNGLESATANYKCSHCDATDTVEVDVTKTIENNKNVYTALVSAKDSLDGEEHKGTKETVDLTIRWSSIDGLDLMDPIILKDLEPGTRLIDAFEENGISNYRDLFIKEGYNDTCYRAPKPYTEYSSYDEATDEDDDYRELKENLVLYEIIEKRIDTIDLTVTIPNVGDSTTTPTRQYEDGLDWDWDNQTNKPVVSVANKEIEEEMDTTWIESASNNEDPYIGKFEDGKKYTLDIFMDCKMGYYFSSNFKVNVNGEVIEARNNGDEAYIIIEIEVAKHNYNVEKNATITEWYKGSNTNGKFVFKRSISDEVTYDRFTGIKVDGNEVPKSNYKVSKGSAIVELNASYLETLSVGEHTLTAMFTDGSVDTKFVVKKKPDRKVVPNTSSK